MGYPHLCVHTVTSMEVNDVNQNSLSNMWKNASIMMNLLINASLKALSSDLDDSISLS